MPFAPVLVVIALAAAQKTNLDFSLQTPTSIRLP
jgi:hypothetical protein